jgi:hypothetical protein
LECSDLVVVVANGAKETDEKLVNSKCVLGGLVFRALLASAASLVPIE